MYTVKQIAEITGLSAYTLRYYDNEGLFPVISRDKNNIRLFSDANLDWINLVHCLRATGLPLADIRKYIELSQEGDSTAEERYHIILEQKEKAEQEVLKMQERVKLLQKKASFYEELLEKEGDFWNPTNCAEASRK